MTLHPLQVQTPLPSVFLQGQKDPKDASFHAHHGATVLASALGFLS